MATHTPGPWIIKGRVGGSKIDDLEGGPIAGPGFVYVNDKEGMANAHLISAAPDLLAAVKLQKDALYKLVNRFEQPSAYEIAIPAIMAGDDAINKAEGGK